MVTAYIVAMMVFLLKLVGIVLAVVVCLLLLSLLLPVSARVRGSASSSGLLEGVLEDDARVVVRTGGALASSQEPDEAVVPVDLDFSLDASVLAGAAGISMVAGGSVEVSVLGVRFRPAGKERKPARHREGRTDGRRGEKPPKRGNAKRSGAKARKKEGVSVREIRGYFAPEVREKTWDALRSLARSLRLRGALDIECGFPDPGNTAIAAASYWALGGPSSFGGITFRPNFCGEMFRLDGSGELWMVPARVCLIAGRYLFSREIRPLWQKAKRRRTGGVDTKRPVREVSAD